MESHPFKDVYSMLQNDTSQNTNPQIESNFLDETQVPGVLAQLLVEQAIVQGAEVVSVHLILKRNLATKGVAQSLVLTGASGIHVLWLVVVGLNLDLVQVGKELGKNFWRDVFFVADANICEDPSINGPTQVSRKKPQKTWTSTHIL